MNDTYYIMKESVKMSTSAYDHPWKLKSTNTYGHYEVLDDEYSEINKLTKDDGLPWLKCIRPMTQEEIEKYYDKYTYAEYMLEML